MMKKVLLGLVALSCVSLAAEGSNLYLKVGGDLYQKFDKVKVGGKKTDVDFSKKDAADFGYEITAEFTREVYPNLELGLGLSYQDHGDPKSGAYEGISMFDVTGFKSIPVYAIAKYNIPVEGNFKPYIKADLGYSFNRDNGNVAVSLAGCNIAFATEVNNGLYYGIGAGVEYNNVVVDLMYKVNKAEIKADIVGERIKKDLDYSRVTLSVGYKFNF